MSPSWLVSASISWISATSWTPVTEVKVKNRMSRDSSDIRRWLRSGEFEPVPFVLGKRNLRAAVATAFSALSGGKCACHAVRLSSFVFEKYIDQSVELASSSTDQKNPV